MGLARTGLANQPEDRLSTSERHVQLDIPPGFCIRAMSSKPRNSAISQPHSTTPPTLASRLDTSRMRAGGCFLAPAKRSLSARASRSMATVSASPQSARGPGGPSSRAARAASASWGSWSGGGG